MRVKCYLLAEFLCYPSKILFAKQRTKEADLSRRGFLSPGRRGLRQPGSCRTEVRECLDERNLREILLYQIGPAGLCKRSVVDVGCCLLNYSVGKGALSTP